MVEVLVVASIITVSVLAAMAVAQKSVYVSRQALHNLEAIANAEGLEAHARSARIRVSQPSRKT